MFIYFRYIILISLLLLSGCCTNKCKETCPECPYDPCASTCPRPKDCAPTVAQITRMEKKICGWENVDLVFELRKRGVEVIEIGDNAIILLPADQFFEVNSQTIREDSYCTLNLLASFLRCYGCTPLYISGHTDNVAPNCFNLCLSDLRAQSIQAYLWVRGIQFRIMCTKGCGNCTPIANQVTVAGNAANRRIEIRIRRTGCFA